MEKYLNNPKVLKALCTFSRKLNLVADEIEIFSLLQESFSILLPNDLFIVTITENENLQMSLCSNSKGQRHDDRHFKAVLPLIKLAIHDSLPVVIPIISRNRLIEDKNLFKDEKLESMLVIPMILDKNCIGAITIFSHEQRGFTLRSAKTADPIIEQASSVLVNTRMFSKMQRSYMNTLRALENILQSKDPYTQEHSTKVSDFSVKLAREVSLPSQEIELVRFSGMLHDIGKIGIDDRVLKKQGKLTDKEYEEMKRHPAIGEEILKPLDFLLNVKDIVRNHHERWDGKGYPDGIAGEDIPFAARILSIADTFEAITADRPYRKKRSFDFALKEISRSAGTQLDPELAKIFVTIASKWG